MKEDKQAMDTNSSADHVDEYLQMLGNEDAREVRYYSQEQPFSSEEMTRLVNEERLNKLMAQSDAFLRSFNDGIKDFENDNKDP
ncbi:MULTISPECIES: hypothetical protein [unclassified Psychrobacter]|jgi:DNA-binding ferritin-like protein|uniref:hypothetical protein n=1 Tax=unclassified Psychrobacter TaxID=196806 RepID=UPI000715EC3E|nr:hypothetical protein [Psychrobacter sp. P11F6]KRG32097.1 hypothetical protein AK822_10895 [Psychrobacter sp. P11F6]